MFASKHKTKQKEEGTTPSSLLSSEQERQQKDDQIHRAEVARSHTLAWIVIGGISLVCACVFLFISFKYDSIGERKFQPKSMEFIASCVCFAFGLFGTFYGTIRTILLSLRISKARRELKAF